MSGATFVARTFSGSKEELIGLIKAGMEHRGMALIDIMFPCVTYNRLNTVAWYKKRVKAIGPDHDVEDFEAAMRLANRGEEEIPTGIYYEVQRPIYNDFLAALDGEPLVARAATLRPDRVKGLLQRFR